MKKILLAFTVLLSTVACTPIQALWHATQLTAISQEADPEQKEILQSRYDAVVAGYEIMRNEATVDRPCEQWFDMAMAAGFTVEQWREPLARIMNAESGCNPMADNNESTARGLLQELEMWADDCGGTYEDLFDPWFNIRCGYHIYQVQGWQAWVTW